LPVANYQTNIFIGLIRGWSLKRNLGKIKVSQPSVLVTLSYSELVTNCVCRWFRDLNRDGKIIHLTIYENFLETSNARKSFLKTLLNRIYTKLLGLAPVVSWVDETGTLIERTYRKDPHDRTIRLSSSTEMKNSNINDTTILPFPTFVDNSSGDGSKRRRVIYFGCHSLLNIYTSLDKNKYIKTVNCVLRWLEEAYASDSAVTFSYKPHPQDGDQIAEGYELGKFELLLPNQTAEILFSKYGGDTIAVYSSVSTACLTASLFGIPAYVLYNIFDFPEVLKKRFEKHFGLGNQKLLCFVKEKKDIGSIDHVNVEVSYRETERLWTKFLTNI